MAAPYLSQNTVCHLCRYSSSADASRTRPQAHLSPVCPLAPPLLRRAKVHSVYNCQMKFVRYLFGNGKGLRIPYGFRPVGITAKDNLIPVFSRKFPEFLVGIIPFVHNSKEIDFKRYVKPFGTAAQSAHPFIVDFIIPRKVYEIRMSKICKAPCLQRLFGLPAIPL